MEGDDDQFWDDLEPLTNINEEKKPQEKKQKLTLLELAEEEGIIKEASLSFSGGVFESSGSDLALRQVAIEATLQPTVADEYTVKLNAPFCSQEGSSSQQFHQQQNIVQPLHMGAGASNEHAPITDEMQRSIEKRERRRAQYRQASTRYRTKKEEHIQKLEVEIPRLEEENKRMRRELEHIPELVAEITRLEVKIKRLRRELVSKSDI